MKKILSLLPPLLCSSLLYHQQINGMRLENTNDENHNTAAAPRDILQENMEAAINDLVTKNPLVLSAIIHSETANIEKPTGYTWGMYLKSFALSTSDLLISSITSEAFQPNNIDHKTLLEGALRECLKAKQYDKIIKILELTHEKHAKKLTISPVISRNIFTRLQVIRHKDALAAYTAFNNERKKTLASLAALSNTITSQLEQLLADYKQQDNDLEKTLEQIKDNYQSAFQCNSSISKKYTLPRKEKQLPKKPVSTINNELLTEMLASTNKCNVAINNHLQLMQNNIPLAIKDKK